MVSSKGVLVASVLAAAGSHALSTDCTARVASLALGDLGSCLALTSLLPVLSASGSIVGDINTYLGSLCSTSTPTCTNSTLTSASSSIQSSCASDIQAGGTAATEVDILLEFVNAYPQVYAGACSKNSTTNGYCVTETLTNVQNAAGTNISLSLLSSILGGDTSSLSSLNSGVLCTGCVQEIYDQALAANGTIANSTLAKTFSSECGAAFASASATPSGVSTVGSAAATSQAASSSSSASASSSAKTGLGHAQSIISAPLAIAGLTLFVATTLGAALVL